MWLVLCGTNDLPALWAARGLEARGLQPLEIVTDRALTYNRGLMHRFTASQPSVAIALVDGRVIDSAAITGTLNRLQQIPADHLRGASETDRQYAEQELFALFISWLYGLPGPVLNAPTPHGLSGAWRHWSEWVWLAAHAGLVTRPYRQSDRHEAPWSPPRSAAATRTIIVVNDTCCGPAAPPPVTAGCRRLAELSQTALLGLDFQVTAAGDWVLSGVSTFPDLTLGGEALLDALAGALRS